MAIVAYGIAVVAIVIYMMAMNHKTDDEQRIEDEDQIAWVREYIERKAKK